MSSVGSRTLDVYVAEGHAGLSQGREVLLWQPCHDLLSGIEMALEAAINIPDRRRIGRVAVNFWLSGKLARPFMLEPVQGIKRWQEVMTMATACAAQATGLEGSCIVDVNEWTGSRPAIATAVQERIRDSVHELAAERRLHVRAIRPWWQAAANESGGRMASIRLSALTDTESSVILESDGERFCVAALYVPALDEQQADNLLRRLAFSSNQDGAALASIRIRGHGSHEGGPPFGMLARSPA